MTTVISPRGLGRSRQWAEVLTSADARSPWISPFATCTVQRPVQWCRLIRGMLTNSPRQQAKVSASSRHTSRLEFRHRCYREMGIIRQTLTVATLYVDSLSNHDLTRCRCGATSASLPQLLLCHQTTVLRKGLSGRTNLFVVPLGQKLTRPLGICNAQHFQVPECCLSCFDFMSFRRFAKNWIIIRSHRRRRFQPSTILLRPSTWPTLRSVFCFPAVS